MEIITKSEKETQEFAKDYAKSLKVGDILALEGNLGSGKTAFTKGIASALGVNEIVTSPTYLIVKEYSAGKFQIPNYKLQIKSKIQNPKLVHVDCYRLTNIEDAESVGLQEYFRSKDNIVIIEWAENIKSILPKRTKFIKFENLGGNKRIIKY